MLSPPRRAKHLASTMDLRAGSVGPVPVCRDPPSRSRVFRVCDHTNAAEPDYRFYATQSSRVLNCPYAKI